MWLDSVTPAVTPVMTPTVTPTVTPAVIPARGHPGGSRLGGQLLRCFTSFVNVGLPNVDRLLAIALRGRWVGGRWMGAVSLMLEMNLLTPP